MIILQRMNLLECKQATILKFVFFIKKKHSKQLYQITLTILIKLKVVYFYNKYFVLVCWEFRNIRWKERQLYFNLQLSPLLWLCILVFLPKTFSNFKHFCGIKRITYGLFRKIFPFLNVNIYRLNPCLYSSG